ncbi:MAG: metallopeptidase TldD-related protein, partial [Bacillota bacterium]|nr:metallopeptidase TldD-related protein [Bacillota bacterium]
KAAFNAVNKLGAIIVSGGDMSVILHSDAALSLLSVILPGFLGDNIRKGQSMLADKLGEVIAPKEITLIDDGLLAGGIASAPFDDEGVPCRKNILIDKGRVNSFLYDNLSAAKAGVASTGSGFTGSWQSLPTTGFTNYYLTPGSSSFEDMVAQVRNGLYIRDFMGLHMANGVSGDFSLGITGNIISNGEVGIGFRGNMVAGNVFDLLKKISAVGKKVEFYGYRGAPPLAIDSLVISGKN